jgi:hypothetical protein
MHLQERLRRGSSLGHDRAHACACWRSQSGPRALFVESGGANGLLAVVDIAFGACEPRAGNGSCSKQRTLLGCSIHIRLACEPASGRSSVFGATLGVLGVSEARASLCKASLALATKHNGSRRTTHPL